MTLDQGGITHIFAQLEAQLVDPSLLLHPANLGVLLYLVLDLHALPRQLPPQEIEQQIAKGLEVVSATLFETLVGGDAGVSGCSYQTLASFDGDMLVGLGIKVPFSESEIDDIHDPRFLPTSSHEIIGFDIAMDEALAVDHLQPRDNLYADVECCPNGESFLAAMERGVPLLEEVF